MRDYSFIELLMAVWRMLLSDILDSIGGLKTLKRFFAPKIVYSTDTWISTLICLERSNYFDRNFAQTEYAPRSVNECCFFNKSKLILYYINGSLTEYSKVNIIESAHFLGKNVLNIFFFHG